MGFLGSSKMDSVKRISLVKPVADILEVDIGDHVVFYEVDGAIVIEKAPVYMQEINVKEKMKILKEQELKELNESLKDTYGSDDIQFEQKDEHTFVMKLIDAPNPEKQQEKIAEFTKTMLNRTATDTKLLLDRLEKLGDLDVETFNFLVEGGNIMDRIGEGLDKYPEEEQERIMIRMGKLFGFDDEEFMNAIKIIGAMSPQELDKMKRRAEKKKK